MRNDKDNIIVKKSFDFALKIIHFCELLESQKKIIIARQLMRAGTSIGANVKEAQNAESKADFVHKLKLAAKEADETAYWLELCQAAENYPDSRTLQIDCNELLLILSKIISSAKKNTK
ncbi:MAG TPA: four helix bundle protein [Saprospirales bacterium]|nr:four helix bundle protein [Saprospirales bacterium]HRQ28583.1 four helix bundle protein [Saprospiraceae bacterium]